MLKAMINYQSLKKNDQTLQCPQNLKKNHILCTAIIVFLSPFMLQSSDLYAYSQEIKAEASDVPVPYLPLPQTAKCSGREQ